MQYSEAFREKEKTSWVSASRKVQDNYWLSSQHLAISKQLHLLLKLSIFIYWHHWSPKDVTKDVKFLALISLRIRALAQTSSYFLATSFKLKVKTQIALPVWTWHIKVSLSSFVPVSRDSLTEGTISRLACFNSFLFSSFLPLLFFSYSFFFLPSANQLSVQLQVHPKSRMAWIHVQHWQRYNSIQG